MRLGFSGRTLAVIVDSVTVVAPVLGVLFRRVDFAFLALLFRVVLDVEGVVKVVDVILK